MSANFQRIAIDLGRQLQTRFPSLRKSTADDKPIDGVNLKDQDARKFNFDFVDEDGEKLVNVTVSLNENDDGGPGLDVQWNEQVDSLAWDKFIRSILPKFAQTHGLNFNAQNPSQSNLVKRDSFGEHNMNESKLFGTSKTSYQQIGEAKIIVRHTQPINLNAPNGRTQHIEHIYVENAIGERFLYPVKHLNGARAMARHMSEGGSFFDDIGNYVIGLSEELSKLRVFKNYVDRSPVISENMGSIQEKVIQRITNIKEEIHFLQSQKNYTQFRESFSVAEKNEVPEDILNDWVDRLTVRSFNEELKDAFPYIYKLVDETQIPIKELSADDILEGDKEYDDNDPPFDPDPPKKKKDSGDKAEHGGQSRAKHLAKQAMKGKEKDVKEFSMFEKYLNQIVSENDDLFNGDEEVQNQAMEQLKQLFTSELPLGTNGVNAIDSVAGIIDEKKLSKAFQLLAELGLDEMDARPIINEFLRSYDAENGTDLSDRLGFDGASAAPAAPASPPPPPAPAPASPPPEAAAPPAPDMAAPAPPPMDPMAAAGGAAPGPMVPNPAAPMMEGKIMHRIVDEIFSRVSGFFNENNGTFTIGEEGFVTKMCKELKEKYHIDPKHPKAEMFDQMVEGACGRIMEKLKERHHARYEQARMLELAGLQAPSFDQGVAEGSLNEMDSQGYKGHRGDEDPGKGPEKYVKPAKFKNVAKDAGKKLNRSMNKAHKKQGVAEGLGNKKVTIQGLKNWIAKAQAEGYEVEEVMKGEMWRAVNPKTGGLKGTFHTTGTPGSGSLWGSGPDGTPADSGTLVIKQGEAEGIVSGQMSPNYGSARAGGGAQAYNKPSSAPKPTNPKFKPVTNNVPSPPDGATAPPPKGKPVTRESGELGAILKIAGLR
jgi:hypothetical protein